ncbi:hypothetical protein Slin15195_G049950 [Septoria linicola]|uniref:Uncharacterized protein n=1 Tax=Septoria linicola TaxID=215465 RepID=A0A9Q9EHC4_9PEZI|nr:hypothetical protein Slin15195_G049950 [Septoria linicola]
MADGASIDIRAQAYGRVFDLYSKNRFIAAIQEAKFNPAGSRNPRYWQIKNCVLVIVAEDDWIVDDPEDAIHHDMRKSLSVARYPQRHRAPLQEFEDMDSDSGDEEDDDEDEVQTMEGEQDDDDCYLDRSLELNVIQILQDFIKPDTAYEQINDDPAREWCVRFQHLAARLEELDMAQDSHARDDSECQSEGVVSAGHLGLDLIPGSSGRQPRNESCQYHEVDTVASSKHQQKKQARI